VTRGTVVAQPKIRYRGSDRVSLTVPRTAVLTVRRGQRVSKRVSAPSTVDGPIPKNRAVGTVALDYRGKVVRTVPLVTASDVPAASLPRKIVATLGVPFAALAFLALVAVLVGALRARAVRAAGEGRLRQR